jgi:Type IV secretion system pilin
MNTLKKAAFTSVALITAADQALAAGFGQTQTINSGLKARGDESLTDSIQKIINYLIGFLGLIALVLALYGGFLMLTAAGDEEKVKKGKTILMQAATGILVIFLAAGIVSLIFAAFGAN